MEGERSVHQLPRGGHRELVVLGAGSFADRLWEIVASASLGKQKGMLWVESEAGRGVGCSSQEKS